MTQDSETQGKSWVESANNPGCDFPLCNLPYGVFDADDGVRIGIAIGDQILDLRPATAGAVPPDLAHACAARSLNPLMALGPARWTLLREWVTGQLRAGSPSRQQAAAHLRPIREVRMLLPVEIGDYTDFFASLYHVSNVAAFLRPGQPLWPNCKYIPTGYHSRASSVVISGTAIRRPSGQTKPQNEESPRFGPCQSLDYELEVGFFAGAGNPLGEPVRIQDAPGHVFGACLLNDWSARDLQFWESQPLGPFLSKSFATSISPWVVPMSALEPFRVPAFARPPGDPSPLPYLHSREDQHRGGIDLTLEVHLLTPRMRASGSAPARMSQGNFRDMYWTVAQMLAHHSSNGCNMRPGDLLGSGTVSGSTPDSLGCLLERTHAGARAIGLPNGEQRTFLEDGDEMILSGYCQRGEPGAASYLRVGFGECRGMIRPAIPGD